MKSCPTCLKTYSDAWGVCLYDNSKLVEGSIAQSGLSPRPSQKPVRKTKLFSIGLVLFPLGFVLNAVFLKLQVHGIPRELSRLATLIGLFLLIFGGLYNLFSRRQAKI